MQQLGQDGKDIEFFLEEGREERCRFIWGGGRAHCPDVVSAGPGEQLGLECMLLLNIGQQRD